MVTPSSQLMKIENHLKSKEPSGSVEGSAVHITPANLAHGPSTIMSGQMNDSKNGKTDSIRRGLEKTIR